MIDQMERKVTITYRWWNEGGVKPEHVEALEESAWTRITEMAAEGYTSGDLHDNIRKTDDDPEDGVEYTGWWEMDTANTDEKGNHMDMKLLKESADLMDAVGLLIKRLDLHGSIDRIREEGPIEDARVALAAAKDGVTGKNAHMAEED